MRYQHLLFSRTTEIDYRWLVLPSHFSKSDRNILEDLFWSDDLRSYFGTESAIIPPTYCIHLAAGSVLLECRRTDYLDNKYRKVDALQGIFVERDFVWLFRFALPWLLTGQKSIINVWGDRSLEYKDADSLVESLSAYHNLDIERVTERDLFIRSRSHDLVKREEQQILEYSESGYNSLVLALHPSVHQKTISLDQFAFGVLIANKHKYKNFDYVAFVGNSSRATEWSHNVSPPATQILDNDEEMENREPKERSFDDMVDALRPPEITERSTITPTKDRSQLNDLLRKLSPRR